MNNNSKRMLVSWSNLPDHLLNLISTRLHHCDYFLTFQCVCATWRAAAVKQLIQCQPSLFLMLPQHEVGNHRSFICPLDGRCFKLNLPGIKRYYDCLGSFFHSWLVMINDYSLEIFLFNPSTEARINLPPWKGAKHDIKRIMLSSVPTDPNSTVTILDQSRPGFKFCRVGDDRWSVHSCELEDFTVFKGKLYLLRSKRHQFMWEFATINTTTIPLKFEYLKEPHHPDSDKMFSRFYLVESGGQLLLVKRYNMSCGTSYLDSLPPDIFVVFRLDLSNLSWVKMEHIGNRVLFLGRWCSVSFSATELGCRENHMYFTEPQYNNTTWWVFNMNDGSIKSTMSSYKSVLHGKCVPTKYPTWITLDLS